MAKDDNIWIINMLKSIFGSKSEEKSSKGKKDMPEKIPSYKSRQLNPMQRMPETPGMDNFMERGSSDIMTFPSDEGGINARREETEMMGSPLGLEITPPPDDALNVRMNEDGRMRRAIDEDQGLMNRLQKNRENNMERRRPMVGPPV